VARRRKTQVGKAASDTIRLKLVTLSNQFTVSLTPVTGGARPPPTQIVYNDGALSGGGTHATIAAAITAASSGSIIELRNRIGGTGTAGTSNTLQTWTQVINLNKAGVTVRVRDGDQVRLRTTGTLLTITANNTVVEGNSSGRNGLELGDPAQWNPLVWGGDYLHAQTMMVQNCANVRIANLKAHGCGAQYYANEITGTAAGITVRNCEFSKHGTNQDPDGGGERGDILRVSGLRVLLEDCDFFHGGHNTLFVAGPYTVIRRCVFDGDFTGQGTAYPGSRGADFVCGGSGTGSNRNPAGSNSGLLGPMLVEDCIIKNSDRSQGDSGGSTYSPAAKMMGYRIIQRQNYFFDNVAPMWLIGVASIGTSAGEILARGYSYHNTSYNCGGVIRTQFTNSTQWNQSLQEYRFVNNIFAGLQNGRGGTGTEAEVVNWNANGVGLNGYTNHWKGSVWRDNLFHGPATLMSIRLVGTGAANLAVHVNGGSNNGAASTVTNTGWAANIFSNDLTSTVNFANIGSAKNRTKSGFAVTGGVGANDAQPLTTATNAASGSINLVVADAGYFYDGWGLAGEAGDYIKIGSGQPVQITAIDWSSNSITLAEGRSWSVGASVFFAGNPRANTAGVVFDNRGAAQ
jgi:hypothetical protein